MDILTITKEHIEKDVEMTVLEMERNAQAVRAAKKTRGKKRGSAAEEEDSEDSLLDAVRAVPTPLAAGGGSAQLPAQDSDGEAEPQPKRRRKRTAADKALKKKKAAEQREAAAAKKKEEKESAASARGTLTLAAKVVGSADAVLLRLKTALAAADGVVQSSATQVVDCDHAVAAADALLAEAQVVLSRKSRHLPVRATDLSMSSQEFATFLKASQDKAKALTALVKSEKAAAKPAAKPAA